MKYCKLYAIMLIIILLTGCSSNISITKVKKDLQSENLQTRIDALYVLKYIGPKPWVLIELCDALSDEDINIRILAAQVLNSMGEKAESTKLSLIGALKDKESAVRHAAVLAIGKVVRPSESVEIIMGVLDDDDPIVRCGACTALVEIGKEAIIALLRLENIANNDSYQNPRNLKYTVREYAKEAVRKIRGK